MDQEKTGRKNVRGLTIFLIAIVVIALAGAITYFVIRPVEASVPTGYTVANCSATSEDWVRDAIIRDTGFQMLSHQNDAENGLTKRFYALDGYSKTWDITMNLRNVASGVSANQFRSGDKINVDMDIEQAGGSTISPQAPRFWLRVMNKNTGKPYSWGVISTTNLKSLSEISIPATFTGDVAIRFTANAGIANCGPAFNVWAEEVTVTSRTGASPTPTQTASSTVTTSPTTSLTPAPIAGSLSLTLKKGFNAVYLPSSVKHLFTTQLKSAGMKVWTFNQLGEKNWATTGATTEKLDHKLGYYIQNPGEQKTVNITQPITTPEESPHKIYPGWNLLANPSTNPMKLNQFGFIREFCPASGTCQAGITQYLSGLSWGIEKEKKAYGIFIIADPYASEADKAFQFVDVNDTNRNTIEIPAGKLFWVYVWPS